MRRIPPHRAFALTVPCAGFAPLVFDSPHSGFEFPPEFRPVATRADIRTTWDAYVDELCAGVVDAGATLLAARFPRACIDANRAASDIDPEVIDAPWPGPIKLSEHGARGMGLIRRFAQRGVRMYERRLSVAEVASRIENFYQPYRRALRQVIDDAWRRNGDVWHFIFLCLKSRAAGPARGARATRPDFAIADGNGTTAGPELTAWVATFFSARGYRVGINHPYRGADIVRCHGGPARRRYSLQIEIKRSLYMNEATGTRNHGFERVRRAISDFARAMAALVRQEPR